jgi:flagellar motor switch protein FliM
MTQPDTLSGDEIAALMGGFRDREAGTGPAVVRPFSFGKEAGRATSALPALDRMNERLARRLRDVLEPFARARLPVAALPVAVRSYEEWMAEQPGFTSLSLYGLKPLKGAVALRIEPALVSRLVDYYYGGTGAGAASGRREFTAAEESLLARLAEAAIGALAEVWAEIVPVRPQLRARETNVAFANLAAADEAVAVARFEVGGAQPPATIEIVYPLAALRAVEKQLGACGREDLGARGEEWRERLAAAVGGVRVCARTVLARPELSLGELMQLAPGDVIPVSLPAQVPLLVEGRPIALGTIGEHDGRAALRVERIENRKAM